jgi:hypothetical protein
MSASLVSQRLLVMLRPVVASAADAEPGQSVDGSHSGPGPRSDPMRVSMRRREQPQQHAAVGHAHRYVRYSTR